MLEFIRARAVMMIAAFLTLGTCAGCAGTQFTQTQEAVGDLYQSAESPDRKALATLALYHETVDTAKVECAKPETPLEICEALETAFDESAERVATASEVWASVMAYRILIADLQALDDPGTADLIATAQKALAAALKDWMTLRPKVQRAIDTGAPLLEAANG